MAVEIAKRISASDFSSIAEIIRAARARLPKVAWDHASAAAETETSPETREALREAAAGTRDAMRRLRTLLVEIHPPNLRASGLEAALDDLLAPLRTRGLRTTLGIDADVGLGEADERLVYRAAAEAIRNVDRHAEATSVDVSLRAGAHTVRLEVVDDGVGFSEAQRERRRDEGHVGLSLLEELAARAGATLVVGSTPGAGTTFALEVPRR